MNDIPCGQCKKFDPILNPEDVKRKPRRGMCIPRSKYPHQEGPGQVFPPGVERVGPGELAQPFIVRRDQIVGPCEFARRTNADPVEEKRKQQIAVTTRKNGKRVHT
jgi:hypothetical protein